MTNSLKINNLHIGRVCISTFSTCMPYPPRQNASPQSNGPTSVLGSWDITPDTADAQSNRFKDNTIDDNNSTIATNSIQKNGTPEGRWEVSTINKRRGSKKSCSSYGVGILELKEI